MIRPGPNNLLSLAERPKGTARPAASLQSLERWATCAGIDPGRTTGIVWLDVPIADGRAWLDGARYRAHGIPRPSTSKTLSVAGQKAVLFDRIRVAFQMYPAVLVVLEEPADARPVWESATRRVQNNRGASTSFHLGEHYGLALGAVRAACPAAAVVSYPVTNFDGRPGWMQAGARRVQPRDATLANLRLLARTMGAPDDLSEDVLCALGVLRWHLASAPTDPWATAAA